MYDYGRKCRDCGHDPCQCGAGPTHHQPFASHLRKCPECDKAVVDVRRHAKDDVLVVPEHHKLSHKLGDAELVQAMRAQLTRIYRGHEPDLRRIYPLICGGKRLIECPGSHREIVYDREETV